MLTSEQIIEACSRAGHEANRAFCLAMGDTSQASWDDAPDWQKSSTRNGVIGVLVDNNTPEDSHESWLKEKVETGWKYGPVKDPVKKEHPCFLPYNQLPIADRMKDHIFVKTVNTVANSIFSTMTPEEILNFTFVGMEKKA
jgi:hypothetical protein